MPDRKLSEILQEGNKGDIKTIVILKLKLINDKCKELKRTLK